MSKRTMFTTITPLPPRVTRKIVIDMLHDHDAMIELNPLVIEHHPIKPPKTAPTDEYNCAWQELTDKVQYIPGGLIKSNVSYNAAFHDLPYGLQTHIYAPLGLDIKGRWTLGGSLPGEPRETPELGLKTPREGLYLREDVDMKCNILMTSFVKKTLKKAHAVLVDRLMAKSEIIEDDIYRESMSLRHQSLNQAPRSYSSGPSNQGDSVPNSPTLTHSFSQHSGHGRESQHSGHGRDSPPRSHHSAYSSPQMASNAQFQPHPHAHSHAQPHPQLYPSAHPHQPYNPAAYYPLTAQHPVHGQSGQTLDPNTWQYGIPVQQQYPPRHSPQPSYSGSNSDAYQFHPSHPSHPSSNHHYSNSSHLTSDDLARFNKLSMTSSHSGPVPAGPPADPRLHELGQSSPPAPVELAGDAVVHEPNKFQSLDNGINRYKSQMDGNPFKHDNEAAPPMPKHQLPTTMPDRPRVPSTERKRRDDPDAASVDFDDEASTHKADLDKEGASLVPQPLNFVQAQAQRNVNATPPPQYTIVGQREHISTRGQ